jgi:hypothetical protein
MGQVRYKETIYAGEQPAIVDAPLWQQVNRQLESQRWPKAQKVGKDALLKGLLWCESCTAIMTASETRKPGRAYRYYVCTNAQRRGWRQCPKQSVRANVIEESILEQVRAHEKLGKRHLQEHVGVLLHRLLESIKYDGLIGRVTLEFRDENTQPVTYLLAPAEKPRAPVPNAHVPRLTRLLALAVKCDGLVRSGSIPDYAELARRGWITPARVTQIMNLLDLAAPIQEEILSWPEANEKRDPVSERALRRLTRIPLWSKQLELWRKLVPAAPRAASAAAGKPVDLSRA